QTFGRSSLPILPNASGVIRHGRGANSYTGISERVTGREACDGQWNCEQWSLGMGGSTTGKPSSRTSSFLLVSAWRIGACTQTWSAPCNGLPPHPHFEYPQFKQVAHPSMITTALVLHLWHMDADGGKVAPSPVTAMSSAGSSMLAV